MSLNEEMDESVDELMLDVKDQAETLCGDSSKEQITFFKKMVEACRRQIREIREEHDSNDEDDEDVELVGADEEDEET